ncbi:MAG: type II toxin-antitoxin system PemK/MazF family toxin [Methyloprofundus sp.]|uniref:type II toxin-antitoxin system PemK/MazF family toxin n=1 Tax=Methyloprofundus sp. TaxID=2020875 RepID=UPI0026319E05|nr:type II toxin-antitoxin system PemK/MazF family toxin [Methyloprofundus sp.]
MVEPRGPEIGYHRRVIMISANIFNQSLIQTVIVVVVVPSNLRLADAPGNFKILKKHSSLNSDSVVYVSQLITLDKSFLTEQVGKLSPKHIGFLNEGAKLVLGI